QTGDRVVAAPTLGELGDNGGPPPTRLPGGDLVNAIPPGTPELCPGPGDGPSVDERGLPPPSGAGGGHRAVPRPPAHPRAVPPTPARPPDGVGSAWRPVAWQPCLIPPSSWRDWSSTSATSKPSTASTSRYGRDRCSVCWGPTAPARRPRCASSPPSSSPMP